MMKKIFTSFLGLSMLTTVSYAQNDSHTYSEVTSPCGTVIEQNRIFNEHPEYKVQYDFEQAQFQQDYEFMMQSYNPNSSDRVHYVVPVAVHIVHLDGPENISDAQAYHVIDLLNEDYSAMNNDLAQVIPQFSGIIGNADFEFRLAKLDPNGNCTNGITRTYSTTTDDTGFSGSGHPIVDAVAAEHGVWPQNKYLNIFVCRSVNNGSAAYTYNPANWYSPTSMYGGIVCLYNYFGNSGAGGSRHTVSHEVGHWFNLSHVWGPNNDQGQATSCSSDDGVTDTPNTIGTNGTCDLTQTTCSSLDNIQNIMDYASCPKMFTQGQVARMITSITGSTADRSNLWTAQNLMDTGVDLPGEACKVRIKATSTRICAGDAITFSDDSYSNISSRTWTFAGGDITTSNDSSVTVTYNTPGTYDVSLEVTGGSTTVNETFPNYITVLPGVGTPLNYTEDFESYSTFPDNSNFYVTNQGNNNTWQLKAGIGSDASQQCISVYNYNQLPGNKDAFESAPIDLSSMVSGDQLLMTFDYAYKKKHSTDNEKIVIYGTNNCGATWFAIKTYTSDALDDNIMATNFASPDAADWQTKQFEIYSLFFVDNFRYKIEFVSDGGNNIYIDNINIFPASELGTNDLNVSNKLSVYPNPTTKNATISYYSTNNSEASIVVYNMIGEKVQTVYNGSIVQGENLFTVSMSNLPKGVYFVNIQDAKGTKTVKLIKE
jgi:plastocyanin